MPSHPVLAWVLPAICGAVAAGQIGCAHFGTLTPWKGGGFGMFSVIDGPPSRFISVVALDDQQRIYRVVVPVGRFSTPEALSARFAAKLLLQPDRKRLTQFANAVLGARLEEPSRRAQDMSPILASSEFSQFLAPLGARATLELTNPRRSSTALNVRQVTVAVRRLRYNPRTGLGDTEAVGPTVTTSVMRGENQ